MKKSLLFLTTLSVLLTACNTKEINERNFVLSLGIDNGIEKNYDVSLGIGNPAVSADGKVTLELMKNSGDTLVNAMSEQDVSESRTTYYGHTNTIIFSKEVLENAEKTKEIVDTLVRNNDFSLKTIVLCAQNTAEEIIKTSQANSEQQQGKGLYVWDYYRSNNSEVENELHFTLKNLEDAIQYNNFTVIPIIEKKEDKTYIAEGAVFDGTKVVGTITEKEFLAYSFVSANCSGYIYEVDALDKKITVFIKSTKTNIETTNEEVVFNLEIVCNIRGDGDISLNNEKTINYLTTALENQLEEEIKTLMDKIKNMNIKEFSNKNIVVNCNAKISGTGVIK